MAPGATLLIDGSSLAYRAYHAIPVITAPDRVTETNAVHGFLNFLSRLIPDRRPSRLWVALDADWRPAFRVDALASYKAHRVAGADDPPDPVEPQIALIIEVLGAFGVSTARAEGYEAEDAIASIAKRTDGQVEVVTGDRDLFALCRYPHVRVLYTLRGVSELAPVDQAWIHAKYGIPGDRYMDYAILRGDPSSSARAPSSRSRRIARSRAGPARSRRSRPTTRACVPSRTASASPLRSSVCAQRYG